METTTSRNGLASRIWRAGLLAMFMLGMSCTPSRSIVKVEPSLSSLQENDTARTAVKVEDITDLIAFETHLSFDANVLEVTELIDGDFIWPDFIVQKTVDNAAGTIDYAVAQIDRPPANGDGTLFEIVFRAKALGQSPILFREMQAAPDGALLSDSAGTAIQVSLINGSIDVSE